MKHVCSLKIARYLYFERVCLSFSMAVIRVGYSGIIGNHINSAQHILLRVYCTPIKYFPYCYVKYIIENLSPKLVNMLSWPMWNHFNPNIPPF